MNNFMHHNRDRLDDNELFSLGSSVDSDNNASLISLGSVDYTDSARTQAPSVDSGMGKIAQSASSVADHAVSSLASTFANLLKSDGNERDASLNEEDLKLVSHHDALDMKLENVDSSLSFNANYDDNIFKLDDNFVSNDEVKLATDDVADELDDEISLDGENALKSTIDNLSPDGSSIGNGIEITHLGDNTDPHSGYVILDAEQEQRYANNRERISAGVSDILTLKEDKRSSAMFTLIERDLGMIEERRRQSNVLSQEEEISGSAEVEDFVTGNITIVEEARMTGTDSGARVSSAAASSGVSISVEDEEDFETVEGANTKRTYGSTLTISDDYGTKREQRLLPMLLGEFGNNWLTYSLAITVCALCLFKVYQVQDTRDLTARLNEVRFTNEELEKQQLILIAQKQRLSEHASIRTVASGQMNMSSPRTENEVVISLK